jgi:hypothetical protein
VHFDKTGQHVEEKRALRRRERRQDAFLRGTRRGAQAVVQRLAARAQSQRAGASVLRIDPPLDMARSGEAMDEVMRAHRIDAQAGRQAALVGVGYFRQRSDHGELDRRQIGALGDLCRDAQADLMEAPRQVGGDPVTLGDAVWGRLRHNLIIVSSID